LANTAGAVFFLRRRTPYNTRILRGRRRHPARIVTWTGGDVDMRGDSCKPNDP
jgi:hypothetical protein